MSGSTWGDSWGACWGDTWGAIETPSAGGGGRQRPRVERFNDDDEIMLLIASVVASGLLQ